MIGRRSLVVLLFAVIGAGLATTPALAHGHHGPPVCGPYPPCPPPTAALSDTVASPGQTDTVHGTLWCPGATITVTLDATQVATAIAGKNGNFSTTFRIPKDESLGSHPVVVSGSAFGCTSNATVNLTVQVSRSAMSSSFAPEGTLIADPRKPAVTFSDLGLIACALGFGMLLFHRRIFPYHPRRAHPLRRMAWRLNGSGRGRT